MKPSTLGFLALIALFPTWPVHALDIDRSNVALGGANAQFIDLGFTAGTGFDGVRNTVELQISTTATDYATPFSAEQLVGFGFPADSNVGGVEGLGSLNAGESVNWLYFNFNPAKDLSKLQLFWTGPLGFPLPGASPVRVLVAENGIAGGNQGLFDIAINYGGEGSSKLGPNAPNPYSKLLFVYDDYNTNIDIADFLGFSAPQGPGIIAAGALVTAGGGLAPVVAVPEPSTYAFMIGGLVLIGAAARRHKAR